MASAAEQLAANMNFSSFAKAKELLRADEGGPKPEPELWALVARQARHRPVVLTPTRAHAP